MADITDFMIANMAARWMSRDLAEQTAVLEEIGAAPTDVRMVLSRRLIQAITAKRVEAAKELEKINMGPE